METQIKGSVKIGHNGSKFHPATKTVKENGQSFLWIHCSCRGTQQGGAYHGAQFFSGLTSNCKN